MVEPLRRPSDGSQPSTDHSRYEVEPQDQVAGGRWLLHVGGSRGLLPGLESATAKISGSGRSGVPPNMSTWRLPSGVAHGAAQPEHDMARPALQHHPTHGARARSARRCRKTHICTTGKRFRPRPVAHSPGPTAPEVAEERRTTPGRSARREELVRANGSIIFRETQDLSFF